MSPVMSQFIKTMIFVDGSNLWWALKLYNENNHCDERINYRKLLTKLLADRFLVRAYYYGSHPEPIPLKQQKFLDSVKSGGFELVLRPLKVRKDPASGQTHYVEKGIDTSLATDLLGMAWENAYDVCVLVTGDADIARATQKVRDKGRRVETASFSASLSPDLKRNSDKTIILDEIMSDIKDGF